jgi:hypothetical protein
VSIWIFATSSAAAEINTLALPDRLIGLSELLLSRTVRESVVPLAVYVPWPISHAVPSSMTYRTTSPSTTPAAAND